VESTSVGSGHRHAVRRMVGTLSSPAILWTLVAFVSLLARRIRARGGETWPVAALTAVAITALRFMAQWLLRRKPTVNSQSGDSATLER